MASGAHGSGGKSANGKAYRAEMQKKGITVEGLPHGVPMTATPITKHDPGLGAKNFPHPYLKRTTKI